MAETDFFFLLGSVEGRPALVLLIDVGMPVSCDGESDDVQRIDMLVTARAGCANLDRMSCLSCVIYRLLGLCRPLNRTGNLGLGFEPERFRASGL